MLQRLPDAFTPALALCSASGLPILAPEMVLLYKSGDATQRVWLTAAPVTLDPHHPWLADL